eukprot:scaffold1086_cov397-Prasinococcus_capsulatus_cf.AAC.13
MHASHASHHVALCLDERVDSGGDAVRACSILRSTSSTWKWAARARAQYLLGEEDVALASAGGLDLARKESGKARRVPSAPPPGPILRRGFGGAVPTPLKAWRAAEVGSHLERTNPLAVRRPNVLELTHRIDWATLGLSRRGSRPTNPISAWATPPRPQKRNTSLLGAAGAAGPCLGPAWGGPPPTPLGFSASRTARRRPLAGLICGSGPAVQAEVLRGEDGRGPAARLRPACVQAWCPLATICGSTTVAVGPGCPGKGRLGPRGGAPGPPRVPRGPAFALPRVVGSAGVVLWRRPFEPGRVSASVARWRASRTSVGVLSQDARVPCRLARARSVVPAAWAQPPA